MLIYKSQSYLLYELNVGTAAIGNGRKLLMERIIIVECI